MGTLYIRNLDADAAQRIKRAAQVRGLTLAEYLASVDAFYREVRADNPDAERKHGLTINTEA